MKLVGGFIGHSYCSLVALAALCSVVTSAEIPAKRPLDGQLLADLKNKVEGARQQVGALYDVLKGLSDQLAAIDLSKSDCEASNKLSETQKVAESYEKAKNALNAFVATSKAPPEAVAGDPTTTAKPLMSRILDLFQSNQDSTTPTTTPTPSTDSTTLKPASSEPTSPEQGEQVVSLGTEEIKLRPAKAARPNSRSSGVGSGGIGPNTSPLPVKDNSHPRASDDTRPRPKTNSNDHYAAEASGVRGTVVVAPANDVAEGRNNHQPQNRDQYANGKDQGKLQPQGGYQDQRSQNDLEDNRQGYDGSRLGDTSADADYRTENEDSQANGNRYANDNYREPNQDRAQESYRQETYPPPTSSRDHLTSTFSSHTYSSSGNQPPTYQQQEPRARYESPFMKRQSRQAPILAPRVAAPTPLIPNTQPAQGQVVDDWRARIRPAIPYMAAVQPGQQQPLARARANTANNFAPNGQRQPNRQPQPQKGHTVSATTTTGNNGNQGGRLFARPAGGLQPRYSPHKHGGFFRNTWAKVKNHARPLVDKAKKEGLDAFDMVAEGAHNIRERVDYNLQHQKQRGHPVNNYQQHPPQPEQTRPQQQPQSRQQQQQHQQQQQQRQQPNQPLRASAAGQNFASARANYQAPSRTLPDMTGKYANVPDPTGLRDTPRLATEPLPTPMGMSRGGVSTPTLQFGSMPPTPIMPEIPAMPPMPQMRPSGLISNQALGPLTESSSTANEYVDPNGQRHFEESHSVVSHLDSQDPVGESRSFKRSSSISTFSRSSSSKSLQ